MIDIELNKALEELALQEFPVAVLSRLKSGKEAQVFVVQAKKDKHLYALKVYRNLHTRSFRTQKHYIEDRYIGDGANIKRAIKNGNEVGKQFVQNTWIMREQYFLKSIGAQTELVPNFVRGTQNGVLMEFIGDRNGVAPMLSEIRLSEKDKVNAKEDLLFLIDLFLQNGIIHGDLSPFNILWWNNQPVVIDFPQAVDVRESKRVYELLRRDLKNTLSIFSTSDEEVEYVTQELMEMYRLVN